MPNRVIKESIKSSQKIDALTWFEEVLYYRLIVSADDYGCYDGRTVLLKNELFPLKENITKKAVEDAIDKLVSVGLLCKYTANGKPYLFFPTWKKHQRLRSQHRKYPDPFENGLTDICQSNDGHMTDDCQPEIEVEVETEIETEKKRTTRTRKAFKPPTLEEVEAYCRQRGNNVDAKRFWEYFDVGDWKDSEGKPVLSWKQKLLTWERHAGGKRNGPETAGRNTETSREEKRSKYAGFEYD